MIDVADRGYLILGHDPLLADHFPKSALVVTIDLSLEI